MVPILLEKMVFNKKKNIRSYVGIPYFNLFLTFTYTY